MSYLTTLNLFLAICIAPTLLIVYFMTLNERKPKNNLILSTTIPKEAWEDPRVTAILRQFSKNLTVTCGILALLYLPALFMEYFSSILTYVMLWLVAVVILPPIPYCLSVKKMRELKKANWYHPELVKIQVADTSLSTVYEEKQNTYTFADFLVPLLVSLIPLLLPLVVPTEENLFPLTVLVLSNASSIILFYFCYHMLRKKADRVNSDPTLSMVLTRIRRYYWGKCWLYISWSCALFSFSGILLSYSETAFLVILGLFTVLLLALTIGMEYKIRSVQQRLNQEQPSEILMDEDDYWPYGIFYYNKNDANLLVNARVGMGSTLNVAHPAGKAITLFSLVITLLLPLTGLLTIKEELSEPQVVLTETAIEAHHTGIEYIISKDNIKSVSLLSELPEVSKKVGTNFPHLYKGNFYLKEQNLSCKLCLDPYDSAFLMIQTTKDTLYIFSMENSEELKRIYDTITR